MSIRLWLYVWGLIMLSENLSTNAEKSLLLEAVIRERLVKTQKAGKVFAYAVVIYIGGAVMTCSSELCL
jgi:hypothetical protein